MSIHPPLKLFKPPLPAFFEACAEDHYRLLHADDSVLHSLRFSLKTDSASQTSSKFDEDVDRYFNIQCESCLSIFESYEQKELHIKNCFFQYALLSTSFAEPCAPNLIESPFLKKKRAILEKGAARQQLTKLGTSLFASLSPPTTPTTPNYKATGSAGLTRPPTGWRELTRKKLQLLSTKLTDEDDEDEEDKAAPIHRSQKKRENPQEELLLPPKQKQRHRHRQKQRHQRRRLFHESFHEGERREDSSDDSPLDQSWEDEEDDLELQTPSSFRPQLTSTPLARKRNLWEEAGKGTDSPPKGRKGKISSHWVDEGERTAEQESEDDDLEFFRQRRCSGSPRRH